MDQIVLPIQKLFDNAKLPIYATDGSGCMDFFAVTGDFSVPGQTEKVVRKFGLGVAVAVPEGYALFLFSRSGHGFKSQNRLSNCVGVIDSDYRGELMVSLISDTGCDIEINPGDRICQGCLMKVPKVQLQECASLPHTTRGAGGFGSTGQ